MARADGTWKIRIQTGKGDQDWHLEIKTAGEDFGGTMTMQPGVLELDHGRIDGDQLTWESTMAPPTPVRIRGKATIDGDSVSGSIDMGAYGIRSFTGSRVQGPVGA